MKKRNRMLSLLLAALLAFPAAPFATAYVNDTAPIAVEAASRKAKITNVTTGTLTLEKGETFLLKANSSDVTWKSSNPKVVTVSKTGKLKAVKKGTAKITVKAGGTKASVEVTVGTKVTDVNVIKPAIALPIGAKSTIKPDVSPADASNPVPTYQSADPEIAAVSKKGVVTAKKAGRTKITVKAADGSKKKETVTVTVRAADSAIRLQDDFYQSVNASVLSEHALKENQNQWSGFYELQTAVTNNLSTLVDKLAAEKDKFEQGSMEQKITDFYMLARDMETRDKAGIEPLKPYLEKIDQAQTVAEFVDVLAELGRVGMSSMFKFGVGQDTLDSNKYALINQGPAYAITKDYITGDANQPIRDAFLNYIKQMFLLAGEDEQKASEIARQVYELQQDFALTGSGMEDIYNVEKLYNPYTKEELAALYSNCDIIGYLEKMGITRFDTCIVQEVENAKKANAYLTQENLELLKNNAKFMLYVECTELLTSAHAKALRDFNTLVMGASEEKDADTTAKELTQSMFAWEFGKLYTDRYFSEESKKEVEEITKQLIATFRSRILKISWLSETTKQEAVKKLDAIKVKIGYPDTWPSYYDDLAIDSSVNIVENVFRVSEAINATAQEHLDKGVNKDTWITTPQTVNAFYNPQANDITFPAAILQAPFYDKNADAAENLGGIGTVIGHEITHAFDTNGSGYDENGNYRNWWTQEDYNQFTARAEKVKNYYNGIEIANGLFQNGDQTVTENIADMGGMACVLEILGDDKEAIRKAFESNAKIWASNQTDQYRDFLLTADVHSLNKVRVNAVLPLFDQFYDVYEVTKNDAMYVAPEDRIQIW
uniref:BIG2 domain-containing protein n=1 Tax=Eubacterium plexicaudatum ASF492 TaxID=1235802 RepID=N2AK88_9FIRM